MKSKILSELMAATAMTLAAGATMDDFGKPLILAVQDLTDAQWDKLSEPAQDYFNTIATEYKTKKPLSVPPDLEPEDTKPARTRSRAAAEPEAEAFVLKVGVMVTATNKRGKSYTGKVVELDSEVLVLDIDGKDEELMRDRLESVVAAGGPGKAAEPDEPADPQVGDTVQVTTARDKVVMGILEEDTDDLIVLKTATGEVEEFAKSRLKKVEIKARGKAPTPAAAPAPATGRGRASAGEADKPERTGRAENGGVAITVRARELMVENRAKTQAQICDMLKAEGLQFKETTIGLVYTETHKLLKMLADKGLLK